MIQQGEDGDRFYIVEEGDLVCTINQLGGTRLEVKTLTSGDYFGEACTSHAAAQRVARQTLCLAGGIAQGSGACGKCDNNNAGAVAVYGSFIVPPAAGTSAGHTGQRGRSDHSVLPTPSY